VLLQFRLRMVIPSFQVSWSYLRILILVLHHVSDSNSPTSVPLGTRDRILIGILIFAAFSVSPNEVLHKVLLRGVSTLLQISHLAQVLVHERKDLYLH
jgi:hypothetical protein